MNSRGATLQGDKLTLTGVSPNAIVFADRPVRAAGHALTTDLIDEWNRDAVVVLKSPKLDGDKLTFDVQVRRTALRGAWYGGAAVAGAAAAGAAAAAYYHPYG